MKSFRLTTSVLAGLLVSALTAGAAMAFPARTAVDLNLRIGPGTAHPRIATMPANSPIRVHRCLPAPAWCEVSWHNVTGWAAERYIRMGHSAYADPRAGAHHAPLLPLIAAGSRYGQPFRIIFVPSHGHMPVPHAIPRSSVQPFMYW